MGPHSVGRGGYTHVYPALVLLVVVSILTAPVAAAPAPDDVHTLTQPDGTEFDASQWGNEWYHGWETTTGYTIVQNATTGWWYYATVRDGKLVATDRAVAVDSPGNLEKHLRGTPPEDPMSSPEEDGGGFSTQSAHSGCSGQIPSTGSVDVPVLLANFNDTSTTFGPSDFQADYFGTGTGSVSGPGTLADYFEEVSHGNLDFGGEVHGWYEANNNHSYYGKQNDPPNNTVSASAAELVEETVNSADSDVDFSKFDNNGDGCVAVIVLHQGAGEEESGDVEDIWSHRFTLAGAGTTSPVTVDGVTVNSYSLQPETAAFGSQIKTIGTIAHETGHLFGVPDLYDPNPDNGRSEGIGEWGLMGSGSYNQISRSGDSPAHPTVWTKTMLGWAPGGGGAHQIAPDPWTGLIPPQANTNYHYRIFDNDGVTNAERGTSNGEEYFLLSTRQKVGFDAGLPGEGMLVWHVNETIGGYPNGNESKKVLDLEAADGDTDLDDSFNRGDEGDPFPGRSDNTRFADGTNPSANFDNGSASGIDIRDIGFTYGAAHFESVSDKRGVSDGSAAYVVPVQMSIPGGSVGDRGDMDVRAATEYNPIDISIERPSGGVVTATRITDEFSRANFDPNSGAHKVTYSISGFVTDFVSSNPYPEHPLPGTAEVGYGSDLLAGDGVTVELEVSTGGNPYEYSPFASPSLDHFDVEVDGQTIPAAALTLTELAEDEYRLEFEAPDQNSAGNYDLNVSFTDEKLGYSATANASGDLEYFAPSPQLSHSPTEPNESETVNFDASGSSDYDGSIVSYEWDLDGDGAYDDATGPTPSWTYANGGDKTVSLRVTDDTGLEATAAETFHVNHYPNASFTHSPTEPNEGETVSFNASASNDVDGSIVSYEWDWDDDGTYENSTSSPTTSHTFPDGGDKTVTLRVTDDDGASNTTATTFHVNHYPNASVTRVTDPAVRNEPVAFDASASNDVDGSIDSYEWDWDDDGTYENSTNSSTTNHTFTTGGDKTVTLRVTDDDDASNTSSVTFHVQIRVEVAIKPGNGRSPINVKRPTTVPVVIENTSAFDPGRVNVSTLRFGDPDDVTVDNSAGATVMHRGGHREDVDDDGDLDLVVHFRTPAADFEETDSAGLVVGRTANGVKLFGTDSVRIISPGPP